jgi:exopolyphosphatase/guanosine-5'-triphosphate,3'-diphosphate pyrophosphatase
MNSRVAIVDLGTNTFHLLIAELGVQPTFFHRERQAVKIGKGGINTGQITEEAIARAIACMKDFREKTDGYQAEKIFAFGTSALRSAANGREVVARLTQASGIEIRIISGEEEAGLIYKGVASAMDLGAEKSLIVDIGGGSVEFIIGTKDQIYWRRSFEIGAQRLLERFQKHDPILPSEIGALDDYFRTELADLFQAMREHAPRTLVGSSGTFDTLSEIFCITKGIPYPAEAGETPLTVDGFYPIYEMLISKNRAQRSIIPGMIEMRVDMIVVAVCLVRFIIEAFSLRHLRVSSYSLKEGILAALQKNEL